MQNKHLGLYKLTIFLLAVIFLLIVRVKANAAGSSLSIKIGVGDTILVLQGKTTPNSVVVFKETNVVIGTTTSDANGDFNKTFNPMSAGIHDINIYSTDIDNKPSQTITISINVLEFNTTTVTNIIIPTTISISNTLLNIGETLRVFGNGVPGSDVNVLFFNSSLNASTTAGPDGFWEIYVSTSSFNEGTHQVYATITVNGGYQSEISEMITFIINDPTNDNPPVDNNDDNDEDNNDNDKSDKDNLIKRIVNLFIPSDGRDTTGRGGSGDSNRSTARGICPLPRFVVLFDYDENCLFVFDEFVDAAKSFVKLWVNKNDPKCDINKDSRCNLTDFSIILYYIER